MSAYFLAAPIFDLRFCCFRFLPRRKFLEPKADPAAASRYIHHCACFVLRYSSLYIVGMADLIRSVRANQHVCEGELRHDLIAHGSGVLNMPTPRYGGAAYSRIRS